MSNGQCRDLEASVPKSHLFALTQSLQKSSNGSWVVRLRNSDCAAAFDGASFHGAALAVQDNDGPNRQEKAEPVLSRGDAAGDPAGGNPAGPLALLGGSAGVEARPVSDRQDAKHQGLDSVTEPAIGDYACPLRRLASRSG